VDTQLIRSSRLLQTDHWRAQPSRLSVRGLPVGDDPLPPGPRKGELGWRRIDEEDVSMKNWEYLIDDDIKRSSLKEYLDELSLGGWELITVVQHTENSELFLAISKQPSKTTS
jgi:hypothetical protein